MALYPPQKQSGRFWFIVWKWNFLSLICHSWIFLPRFVLPFLKGFPRASLAPSRIPTWLYILMYSSVGFSPLSALGTSVISFWVWKLKYPHWFSTLFPKIYLGLYYYHVLNLQLSRNAHVGIPALSHCHLPSVEGSALNAVGQELVCLSLAKKSHGTPYRGAQLSCIFHGNTFPPALWTALCQFLSLSDVRGPLAPKYQLKVHWENSTRDL